MSYTPPGGYCPRCGRENIRCSTKQHARHCRPRGPITMSSEITPAWWRYSWRLRWSIIERAEGADNRAMSRVALIWEQVRMELRSGAA